VYAASRSVLFERQHVVAHDGTVELRLLRDVGRPEVDSDRLVQNSDEVEQIAVLQSDDAEP